MATPVLTKSLTQLRADFDSTFTNRGHGTDGWIGDAAHQGETSGHNPDDTPGVKAEYSDSDTKPEVRAIDVDKDLNSPDGVTMLDVIEKLIATPNDTKRLKYIIHCPVDGPLGYMVPTIWKKSTGWRPERYTGANPHDEHAHLSGDAAYDEDDSPWSVREFGGMEQTDKLIHPIDGAGKRDVGNVFTDLSCVRDWEVGLESSAPGQGAPPAGSRALLLHQRVATIETTVKDLMTKAQADALLRAIQDLTTAVQNSTGAAGNYDAVLVRRPE